MRANRLSLRGIDSSNGVLLMAAASFSVLAGCTYTLGWISGFTPAIGLILLGIALSVAAIARSARSPSPRNPATEAPVGRHTRFAWVILAVLLLGHAVSAVFLERTDSAENIDCYTFQRDAVKTLLHGRNPYGGTQANIYTPEETRLYYGPGMVVDGRVLVGLQYPPLTLFWAMPGYLLGDVRYSYVLADLISAVLCFLMFPDKRGLLLSAFLLIDPVAYQVESRCWTEPMVFMALCFALYAARQNRWWLPIALGMFLATKQYNFVALPLLACFVAPFRWKVYLSLLGRSVAVAVATLLPFALWNPRALWHDLVVFHLAQPFRADALSLAVISPVFLKVGPLLLIAFIAWVMWVARPGPAIFAAAYGTCLLLFFSTGKQAFGNYYFLIGHTLMVAAAGWPVARANEHAGQQSGAAARFATQAR